MDENGIKAAVLTRIRQRANGRQLPMIASEFSLNGTGIRADLAVLDSHFYGVEIKSAADSLKRLPNQMEGYARYFDRTLLVVAPRHLQGLRGIDLHGAEVWRQEVLRDWDMHAPGQPRRISGHWLLNLLTVEEERRATRSIDQQRIDCETTDIDQARRTEFEKAFCKRYGSTSTAFWDAVRGRQIRVEDLKLLSRFGADRTRARQLHEEFQLRWLQWEAEINSISSNDQSSQSSSVSSTSSGAS